MDSKSPFGNLNDFWKFSLISGQWTWIGGSDLSEQIGSYGIQGIGSNTNIPGAREGTIAWVDSSSHFWLFSGQGRAKNVQYFEILNDLWRYDPVTGEWMWVKGTDQAYNSAICAGKGNAADSNIAGGRSGACCWKDQNGHVWFFGGFGVFNQKFGGGGLSDLWKISSCTMNNNPLTISSSDSTICVGETVALTASGSNNYTWSKSNSSGNVLNADPGETTIFWVATYTNGCRYVAALTQSVDACLSLNNRTDRVSTVGIYPNPCQNDFTVRQAEFSEGIFEMYDRLGRLVLTREYLQSEFKVEVPEHGTIYFWRLTTRDQSFSGKIVAE